MIWKVLLTLGLLLLAWSVLFGRRGGRRRIPNKPARNPLADQTLVKCKDCGIYIAAGDRCNCKIKG